MKKFLLLLLFFAAKNIISQNGWTTYTTSVPTGTTISQETVIFIDNAGNKWVGFNGAGLSGAAFAKYDNASSSWTFWNRSTMAIFSSTVSSNVKAFAQDNLGDIWIGTASGLIKYNGVSFTVYNTASGLPSNAINCLEYSNNMLYIGTQNGLSRYDGTTFTNYTVANTLFPITNILDVKAENANTIWATSVNTLVKFFINSTFTSTSYTSAVATNSLSKIYIDAVGTKWLSSYSGIIKYDNVNFTYFNTLYPNFIGGGFDGLDIGKGPNNGILVTAPSNAPGNTRCFIEFLSGGNYNFYYTPLNMFIGTSFESDASGKLWVTGLTASLTVRMHSIDASLYNASVGYWWGPGITSDNYKYLDVNRVKAGIMNRGDMWWDIGGGGNASYEVPKGSGIHSGFGGSLWMGGLDASNQLHIAGQTYRQTGNDFWPGPLDTTNASIDSTTVMNYDKIWKVDYNDINTFITQFNLGNVPLTYTPTTDIMSWPAKGTGNKAKNLAPFVDVNNNGIYDPLVGGDYPKIKGDQTLYFIFNDNFTTHSQTGGLAFGVEVHAMAYAYGCSSIVNGRNELAYTTFYDYKIYNRSSNNYHDMYIGFWNDVDLGGYLDDYVGSSVHDNLGFSYNSDSLDQSSSGSNGYNNYPPAAGTTILKGPLASSMDGLDNDNDSIVDEIGEECLLNIFDYYNNNISFPVSLTNPNNKYHVHNYLTGRWKDSTFYTCGGNAYGGTTPTKHVFPWTNYLGNPCGVAPWSESTAGNLAGDRRYVASSGPFNFPANSMTEFEYAYVWSVDSSATSNINIASVNKLISDTRKIRSFYKTGAPNCLSSINIGVEENVLNDQLLIYPNPANSVLNIKSENSLGKSVILITDVLGKTIIETKNNDLYQTSINIELLSSGVYLLQLKSEKGIIVKKFVKE
ncbi:MAG: T9SS type A sorting domain-containing protein [Bacteroidia bacterium]|nr:T9SS type A sorting domain-containing protein [Bacteroidia bacterium]